jgi:hypothetical protein
MKKYLILLPVLAILAGCNTTSQFTKSNTALSSGSSSKDYNYQTSKDIVRSGQQSQRFEIRHGDCVLRSGHDDCEKDRQRVEKHESATSSERHTRYFKSGEVWYNISYFFPEDFPTISPAYIHVGQVKMKGVREPLWMITAGKQSLYIEFHLSGQTCTLADRSQILGKWTDVMIRADYTTTPYPGFKHQYADIYINGNRVECNFNFPLVKKWYWKYVPAKHKHKAIRFQYGIYNSYVSRWLNANKTTDFKAMGFYDTHAQSGHTSFSMSAKPFDVDWGVKLPTQVLYYDEIRMGKTREEVDINIVRDPVD